MVKWLKVGGYIFFRESCFHQSGDHKRKNNPTHYRVPRFYTKVSTSYPSFLQFAYLKAGLFSYEELLFMQKSIEYEITEVCQIHTITCHILNILFHAFAWYLCPCKSKL